MRTIGVPVDVELLDRAQELHIDVPRLMVAALAERVAATHAFTLKATVEGDSEAPGSAPLLTIPVDPSTGRPL